MQNQRKTHALLLGAACLGVLVGAAGCSKDKPAPPIVDQTVTTAASVTVGVADPATDPASPVGMRGRGAKERGMTGAAPTNGDPMIGANTNGPPALPGQITPPKGDSFESSGGSSGLGAPPRRDVPGQHIFDVKPTAKRDGG